MPWLILNSAGTAIGAFQVQQNLAQAAYAGCTQVLVGVADARLVALQAAQAKVNQITQGVSGGLQITSATSPGLNATYAIDPPAQLVITGIYAGIIDGAGLPSGSALFQYPDMSGAMHSFDAAHFEAFATAVRNFLYQLEQQQNPTQPVAIG